MSIAPSRPARIDPAVNAHTTSASAPSRLRFAWTDLQRPAVAVQAHEGPAAELRVAGAPLLGDLELQGVRPHAAAAEGAGVGVDPDDAEDEDGAREEGQDRADRRPPVVEGAEDGVEDGEGAVAGQRVHQAHQAQRAEGEVEAPLSSGDLDPGRERRDEIQAVENALPHQGAKAQGRYHDHGLDQVSTGEQHVQIVGRGLIENMFLCL